MVVPYVQSYSCCLILKFSLGPLVRRIKEAQVLEVIDQLSNFAAQQKNDELRGIASIGNSMACSGGKLSEFVFLHKHIT